MKFAITRDYHDNVIRFSGEITPRDLVQLKLDKFDTRLLRDIDGSSAPPADYLLVLEMLFRRYAEQQEDAACGTSSRAKALTT